MFGAPALLSVTPATTSPFVNPATVNAFVPKFSTVLYALLRSFAVITNGAAVMVRVPRLVVTL